MRGGKTRLLLTSVGVVLSLLPLCTALLPLCFLTLLIKSDHALFRQQKQRLRFPSLKFIRHMCPLSYKGNKEFAKRVGVISDRPPLECSTQKTMHFYQAANRRIDSTPHRPSNPTPMLVHSTRLNRMSRTRPRNYQLSGKPH